MTLDEELPLVEFCDEVCGLYFRSIILQSGQEATQHVHDHDHATYIGNGSVRFWAGGELIGDFPAGHALPVHAGVQHRFMALESNTRLTCVHDCKSAESIKGRGL